MCSQPHLSFKCTWRKSNRLTIGGASAWPRMMLGSGFLQAFSPPVAGQRFNRWLPLSCCWFVTECPFFLMCRVLVGAPKADSKYSTSVKSPGAVFKCRVHTNPDRRCTELDMARGGWTSLSRWKWVLYAHALPFFLLGVA